MKYVSTRFMTNMLISTILLILWVAVNYLLFYPSTNGMGDFFGVSIMYIITTYTMLIVGALVLLLRFVKILQSGHTFVVVLSMELNIVIGVTSIILYVFNKADLPWVNKSLLNLLVGVLLLGDCILFREKKLER